MKNYAYYGVFGSDNFSVYDDYSLARKDVAKVENGKIKGFNDYDEARDYALTQYIWMHLMHTGKVARLFNEDGTMTLNKLVFKPTLYRVIDTCDESEDDYWYFLSESPFI